MISPNLIAFQLGRICAIRRLSREKACAIRQLFRKLIVIQCSKRLNCYYKSRVAFVTRAFRASIDAAMLACDEHQ